jgi:hypothetical protein
MLYLISHHLGIDGGIINKIVAVWRDNYGELSSTLVGNTLQINKLLDMEWRFGSKSQALCHIYMPAY